MKKQITAAVMMLSMIAPSMANGLDNQTFENQVFHTQADAPMQLAELSQKEMKETEGAWGPVGAFIGGVGGGIGYMMNQQLSGSRFSPTAFTLAVGAGDFGGATAGPAGVVWGFNRSLATGMVTGVAQRYGK